MKSLNKFIKESIDDNLFWKIDKYFEKSIKERNQFLSLVRHCRKNPGFTNKDVEEWIKENEFINLKKFVDFVDDVVKIDTTDRDYTYILYKIIKLIIANKSEGEKYK